MTEPVRWVSVSRHGTVAATGHHDPPPGALAVDGCVLVPGFVDLQVNGVGTVDFATADPVRIAEGLRALAASGTTACLPTLVSAPRAGYPAAIERILEGARLAGATGAAVLGVHLEGPFLGSAPGAHLPEMLSSADPAWAAGLLDRFPGVVRLVTLAPEADPGFGLTRLLAERGVLVSLGHTTVGYEGALAAADAGARLVTHLFNAMSALHHRAPGLVGAALTDERLVPGLICDLVHVHPAVVRLAVTARPDLFVVSDAVAAAAGTVGGIGVRAADGAARTAQGVLAGATVALAGAVANLISVGVPLAAAVAMAGRRPADLLGATDHGRLGPGARADVVALDAATHTVRQVWLGGVPVRDR